MAKLTSDIIITMDPDAKATLDKWTESLAALACTQALRCDGCGVTIVRPVSAVAAASQYWSHGDNCAFTEGCEGYLREYHGVFLGMEQYGKISSND